MSRCWSKAGKNLKSGMKEAKLCLARPFPFLFPSASIVVLSSTL
jgi:hypothetical protein